MFGALLEVDMSKKCTRLWREAHFEVKSAKKWRVRSTFGRSDVVLRGRRKGLCTWSKVNKIWGFCSTFKNNGTRGTFEETLQRCFRVAGAVQETHELDMLGGQGADFLRGVAFLEHRIFRFAKMICVTDATLRMTWHHYFVEAQHFRQMEWKNRKMHWHEAVNSALNFPCLKEVCFFFDAVIFESSGPLAEFFRFWLLVLSSSKTGEVSQHCCVFDVVKFKKWGSLAE